MFYSLSTNKNAWTYFKIYWHKNSCYFIAQISSFHRILFMKKTVQPSAKVLFRFSSATSQRPRQTLVKVKGIELQSEFHKSPSESYLIVWQTISRKTPQSSRSTLQFQWRETYRDETRDRHVKRQTTEEGIKMFWDETRVRIPVVKLSSLLIGIWCFKRKCALCVLKHHGGVQTQIWIFR